MYIDHHFQSRIIDELWAGSRTFTQLKPEAVENSLFMYHLRKLIARGIVIKLEHGYTLTPEGTRWAHKLDPTHRTQIGLRTLVQLFVIRDGQLLISERQGVTATHMNRYLLPSALHAFGMSREECIDTLARRLKVVCGELLTQVETIMPSQQLHTISDIYGGTYDEEILPRDETDYHYQWIALDDIAGMSISEAGALPMVTRKYLAETLQPRELARHE